MQLAIALVLSTLGLAGCAEESRVVAPPRAALPPIPPRPQMTRVTADFGPLFASEARSNSVYLPARDQDLMKRILLGPNLVFEASRSSLDEPRVTGPVSPPPTAPDLSHALGAPVDIQLSSLLLSYLGRKGSTLVAPVISRRWGANEGTWVERAMLTNRPRAGAKDIVRDVRPDMVPTAALAVRRLGRVPLTIDVVADQTNNVLSYRFRRSATDASVCPPVSFEIPVLVFSAEIVSLQDGRLLARIDEALRVVTPSETQVPVEAVVPVENEAAVRAMHEYAAAIQRGSWVGQAPSLPYWLQSDVRCKAAEEAFRRIARDLANRTDAELDAAATRLFAKVIEPLYDVPPAADAAAKARPRGSAPKGQ